MKGSIAKCSLFLFPISSFLILPHYFNRMRNAFFSWGLLLFCLLSCADDEALLAEVQKEVEIRFLVNTDRAVSNAGTLELSESLSIVSDEFNEFQKQIRDFQVNQLRFQITGVDQAPGMSRAGLSRLSFFLSELTAGANAVELIEMTDLPLDNIGQPMVLYKRDSFATLELREAISFIRTRLVLEQPFLWEASGEMEGSLADPEFEMIFLLDLTAEVILP